MAAVDGRLLAAAADLDSCARQLERQLHAQFADDE